MTSSSSELSSSSGVPLYRQIKSILQEEISSGRVDSATPITEAILLDRFRVSRAPIRQALKELTDDGFVYRKQGRGTFPVPGPRIDRSATTRPGELFQQLKSQGLNPTTKVEDLDIIVPPEHVQNRLQLSPTDKVLYFVRVIYVEDRPISYSTNYIHAPAGFAPTAAELETGLSAFNMLERDFGIALVHHENQAWATAAANDIAAQLDIAVGSPVLAIETVFITTGGKPAGFRLALHGSDEFKFHFNT